MLVKMLLCPICVSNELKRVLLGFVTTIWRGSISFPGTDAVKLRFHPCDASLNR